VSITDIEEAEIELTRGVPGRRQLRFM